VGTKSVAFAVPPCRLVYRFKFQARVDAASRLRYTGFDANQERHF
jgi:hypothetical protein